MCSCRPSSSQKASGSACVVRVPLEAMGDVDYPTRGPDGLLDLDRIDRALADAGALWLVPALRCTKTTGRLGARASSAARISLPSDRSFSSYDQALAHVDGPAARADIRSLLEPVDARRRCWTTTSGRSTSAFAIQSVARAARCSRRDGVAISPAGRTPSARSSSGATRTRPARPSLASGGDTIRAARIQPHPRRADHLLFLVCLAIPLRRLRALVPVVTAFAVAHSITLIASAFDIAPAALWFPPLVETLIAISIVYMALENMLAPTVRPSLGGRLRVRPGPWLRVFGFALRESLQFAGSHLVSSLLSFNVGVELGQLLVLALLIPPLTSCSGMRGPNGSARSSCRRSSRTPPGTGWSIEAANCDSSGSNGRRSMRSSRQGPPIGCSLPRLPAECSGCSRAFSGASSLRRSCCRRRRSRIRSARPSCRR